MGDAILERVRDHLLGKQTAIGEWLGETPADKRALLLGPSNQEALLAHLGAIGQAIAEADAGTLGVCRVCGECVEDDRLEVDYRANVCIDHLSKEERSRLEDELELARTVQKALLPQEVPHLPGVDIAAYSRPVEFLGGDYFDFIDFGAEIHGLIIADVAGHGVSASLQMASLQALARAIIPSSRSPAQVAQHIHDLFKHNIRFTTFVTLFVASYSPATRRLVYCNAGHNPPLALHPNRSQAPSISWLWPTGPAIGLVEAAEFGERELTLHPGDLLVLYTDGVVEATDPNNDLFGTDRLAAVVERWRDSSSRDVVRNIRQGIEEFTMDKPLADDTTLVVCRIT